MRLSVIRKFLSEVLTGIHPDREIEAFARIIAEDLTGMSGVEVRLNQDLALTPVQTARLIEITERLKHSEPIQYILGETEFYGLPFRVGPGVLIPRGETEELVELIIRDQKGQSPSEPACQGGTTILDIGCGSGAIAIALARNLPDAQVLAVDVSGEALTMTRDNARLNQVPIQIFKWDVLNRGSSPIDPLTRQPFELPALDVIVSNPPYIPLNERDIMDRLVTAHEPDAALFVPDADPLIFYRQIIRIANAHLRPEGCVYVEVHHPLALATKELFQAHFGRVDLFSDIHGRNRMIRGTDG